MKKYGLAVALLLQSFCFCEEQDVPVNPELEFVNFEMMDMNENAKNSTGVNKLTPLESASLQTWLQDREAEEELPQESAQEISAAEEPVQASLSDTISVQEVRENGRLVIGEDGRGFKVPMPLRKKAMSWKKGDILRVEPTSRQKWVRLTNAVSNESILAKVEEPTTKKEAPTPGS